MAIERLERGRRIVRGSLLPTSIEATNPFERQGPHGGLMGFPLVTLLLIIDLCPEGMPDRLRRPLHERLPKKRWALEAPVHPGLLAAADSYLSGVTVSLKAGLYTYKGSGADG